jgi:hypothetical protein
MYAALAPSDSSVLEDQQPVALVGRSDPYGFRERTACIWVNTSS